MKMDLSFCCLHLMGLQAANDPKVLQIERDEIVEAVKKNNVPVDISYSHMMDMASIKRKMRLKDIGRS